MITIRNDGSVKMSCGDSVVIDVTIDGLENYNNVESVEFNLSSGEETLLTKPVNNNQLSLMTADTKELSPGTYDYDVVVNFAGGEQYTLNFPLKFTLVGVCSNA